MYLSRLTLRNFRQFGDNALDIPFNKGVTALIGRNDCGKSAVIDAIRYALLTRDQGSVRVQLEDFHIDESGAHANEIFIRCQLSGLDDEEKGAFAEYLSYDGPNVTMYVNWTARRRSESPTIRRWVDVSVRSGVENAGPPFEASVRELLASTYLRPLRDAAREMSPGRGSRLSQILANIAEINEGAPFDEEAPPTGSDGVGRLSLLGLTDYLRHSIKNHPRIRGTEEAINTQYLSSLFLSDDSLRGRIDLTDGSSKKVRLRQILERLELGLLDESTDTVRGQYGLGSNNLLYMACELLLLGREPDGLPLLLIEEPEAHLHPQRQLRLMDFLTKAADTKTRKTARPVQVILSTHSPSLASTIPLEDIVILENKQAFPLSRDETNLCYSDYKFLERFLDATKANLFFAHGVIIVEGDSEVLLLPTLARLIGMDLTEHGVSIVNVGGQGLRRYSKIFQRRNAKSATLSIPVACIADLDIMPDRAPIILGLVESDHDKKWKDGKRRWKTVRDLVNGGKTPEQALDERRQSLCVNDGQTVRTFISNHWTLEYDLAFHGLDKEVYIATELAKNDQAISDEKKTAREVEDTARKEFESMKREAAGDRVLLCSQIYKNLMHTSKTITAQHLAAALAEEGKQEGFDRAEFINKLPSYIVDAIAYACRAGTVPMPAVNSGLEGDDA